MIPTTQQSVNGISPADPQRGIGDNGGPEFYVREIKKLTAIEAVLKNPKFSQTQALILIGLIVRSDESYQNAFPGGATLALYAKVKRTDAVFKALRELEDQFKVISRESRGHGRSNSYTVIPQRVVDAVVAAYEERKAAKAASATMETHPPETGDSANQSNPSEPGEIEKPTLPKRAPSQEGHPPEAGAGHPPKAGTYPVSIRPKEKNPLLSPKSNPENFWQNAFGSSDVLLENGNLTLVNGFRIQWLEEFGGDEKDLSLALTQAARYIEPNSHRPLEVQVSSQLARYVREKRNQDARYAAASAKSAAKTKPFKPSRWAR